MQLSPSTTILPFLHGKVAFAEHVRSLSLSGRFDCIAVDLPPQFHDDAVMAVDNLPYVSAVLSRGVGDPVYYLPIDPCDATIEAIRQSRQNRLPCTFVGSPVLRRREPLAPMPDEQAIRSIGFEAFASLCILAAGNPKAGGDDDREALGCAIALHELETRHRSILALVHLRHYARTVLHFSREQSYNTDMRPDGGTTIDTAIFHVNPDHLYFALGELPFVAGKYERMRQDPFASDFDPTEIIKELFRETRNEYYEDKDQILDLSPARIRIALHFLRNLSVMSGMLLPSLFDIVAAAKGVGGNGFAVRILKSAKYYPYLPVESQGNYVSIGIDRIALPGEADAHDAVNLFRDTALVWRTLSIKPDPTLDTKKRYRFKWNPLGMCSHVPEDRRIESFNTHVRKKALRTLTEDLVRSEKFSTSVKDGIDIRETLRNWYTGGIYVKELPPGRGNMDTVVIIFDQDHDDRYPHCATWFAEHGEESTLTFYATDPMENMVGPGIARSQYGGLSLLYPPRSIPNVFEISTGMRFKNLAQRLTYGALLFSGEKNIAYIAVRKPDVTSVRLATRMRRHLVWIPLASFSNETLRRLQRFHVLNGKTVRSWAARFIGD